MIDDVSFHKQKKKGYLDINSA